MAIRKNSKVTMTVTGHSDENIRQQVKDHFQLVEIEFSPLGEIKTTKFHLVKMLREFEKKFYGSLKYGAPQTGLLELKTFVEDYIRIR